MSRETYLKNLKRYAGLIFGIITIITASTFLGSVLQHPKYSSEVQLLVVQGQTNEIDAFAAVKSAEQLGYTLMRIVHSDDFFDRVMKNSILIDQSYFPEQSIKRVKEWERTVKSGKINDTGILTFTVYHPQPRQAELIASAVSEVLETQGERYHKGGGWVDIRLLTGPLTSERPTKPDILVNTIFGVFLGIGVSLGFIYLISGSNGKKFFNGNNHNRPASPYRQNSAHFTARPINRFDSHNFANYISRISLASKARKQSSRRRALKLVHSIILGWRNLGRKANALGLSYRKLHFAFIDNRMRSLRLAPVNFPARPFLKNIKIRIPFPVLSLDFLRKKFLGSFSFPQLSFKGTLRSIKSLWRKK